VPFGSCSIFSTADCFEDEAAGDFGDAGFVAAVFEAVIRFDPVWRLPLAVRFAVRGDLRVVFADFDFDLLMAIWPSVRSTTATCAATDATPPIGGRGERL
jgi:hypothetical protein